MMDFRTPSLHESNVPLCKFKKKIEKSFKNIFLKSKSTIFLFL